jgi:hypothetical protein
MAIEVPYTSKPEDVTRLLQLLPTTKVPADKIDAGYLKSLGFSTGSGKHLLNILKMLGFIDEAGKPSATWSAYAVDGKRGLVLASAIKRAYPELFASVLCPYLEDDEVLFDFLKRNVKASPREMELMLQTFRNLVEPADFQDLLYQEGSKETVHPTGEDRTGLKVKVNPDLQINLQVHIDPETSDEKIETIFKNMRKYLLGKDS